MAYTKKDGDGALSRNPGKDENHPNWPDYKGSLLLNGQDYWLSGWVKDGSNGKFLSLRAEAKKAKKAKEAKPEQPDLDDEIPF